MKTNMSIDQFALYNQALAKYNKEKDEKESELSDLEYEIEYNDNEETLNERPQEYCLHSNITTEKGVEICMDCGTQLVRKISHDKEWRYYGQSDSRHSSDPNRVQPRKSEDRNIYKDVENMGFSEKIVTIANKIYADVTKGKIFRGNSRKSIVFATIFHSYKLSGKPQTHERLIGIFDLNRKIGLKGLKYVNLHAPKESSIRTTYITPINLVEEIMDKFSATRDQKDEVINLYKRIKNRSSRLNRSRPQSVASSIVFYWICLTKKDITLKEFTSKVSLSELTISKIAKEIANVLGDTTSIKN
jgi:transcription initiation factor TFIIIB Brf1 subunit/transcription initiation factor TFIIB